MKMLLEITLMLSAMIALIPMARKSRIDSERFAHLDSVGTFGM